MLRWIPEIAQGGMIAVQTLRGMLNFGAFVVDQTNEKIVALIATAVSKGLRNECAVSMSLGDGLILCRFHISSFRLAESDADLFHRVPHWQCRK